MSVLSAITRALEGLSPDPAYLEGMRMVVPGVAKLYGGRVPVLREIARSVAKAYRRHPEGIEALAMRCWQEGSREHRLIALFLLAGLKAVPPARRWQLGLAFLPDVSDWETCDQLCHALLGQALSEDPQYMDALEGLAGDANPWLRRAALVSTVLLRRAKYDAELARALDWRALELCGRLLEDEEHYIRKAVDWALREVIKRHPQMAFEWMISQVQNGPGRVGRTTLRQATRKLPEEARARLLAELG